MSEKEIPEKKVLIVDDNPIFGEIFKTILILIENFKFEIQQAYSIKVAEKVIKEFAPDLILCDGNVDTESRFDGFEFAKKLRQKFVDEIKLVSISGSNPDQKGFKNIFDFHHRKDGDPKNFNKKSSNYFREF